MDRSISHVENVEATPVAGNVHRLGASTGQDRPAGDDHRRGDPVMVRTARSTSRTNPTPVVCAVVGAIAVVAAIDVVTGTPPGWSSPG